MSMFSRAFPLLAACLISAYPTAHADAITIDFDSLEHGEIVNTQFSASYGVMIRAVNVGGGPDLALAFDSLQTDTADPDLEGPSWRGGNLDPLTSLGRLLIVAENSIDRDGDQRIDSPDDEGSRPAGSLFFEFEVPILSFGFDLIDVEGPEEFGPGSGFFAVFYDENGAPAAQVSYGEFIDSSSPFHVPGTVFGNNSVNRITPITAEALGLSQFYRVELNMGGSGAIDNIDFQPIPEPAPLVLVAAGLALTALIRIRSHDAEAR
jgi:hypothetical protein